MYCRNVTKKIYKELFCLFFKFKLNITHKQKCLLKHTILKRTEARGKSCLLLEVK